MLIYLIFEINVSLEALEDDVAMLKDVVKLMRQRIEYLERAQ